MQLPFIHILGREAAGKEPVPTTKPHPLRRKGSSQDLQRAGEGLQASPRREGQGSPSRHMASLVGSLRANPQKNSPQIVLSVLLDPTGHQLKSKVSLR